MTGAGSPRIVITTAPQPGAVAIVQLHGDGSRTLLERLTGAEATLGRLRLSRLPEIDEAVTVAVRENWVQIMPHGGPHVIRKLVDRLIDLGGVVDGNPDARTVFPEADSTIEADMLAAMARAASPAAIDLLAAQPALWRSDPEPSVDEAVRRSGVLDRLIDPPTVVVVGRPNVGKSTLTNAMLGRSVSLVADLPGTTRDWVAGMAELTMAAADSHDDHDTIAVNWLDTPGLRTSDDPIEREAIAIARRVISAADVVIVMRDPEIGWPDLAAMPRKPDLYVMNKIDDGVDAADAVAGSQRAPLPISARDDRGLNRLQAWILSSLGLTADALMPPRHWAFSKALKSALQRGDGVEDYVSQCDAG